MVFKTEGLKTIKMIYKISPILFSSIDILSIFSESGSTKFKSRFLLNAKDFKIYLKCTEYNKSKFNIQAGMHLNQNHKFK